MVEASGFHDGFCGTVPGMHDVSQFRFIIHYVDARQKSAYLHSILTHFLRPRPPCLHVCGCATCLMLVLVSTTLIYMYTNYGTL